MHTKLAALAATALATAAIAGCSTGGTDANVVQVTGTVTHPATADTAAMSGSAKDEIFLEYVNKALDIPKDRQAATRSSTLRTGHQVCATLDSGSSVEDTLLILLSTDTQWNAYQIGQLLGASVAAYCPQYSADITAAAQ